MEDVDRLVTVVELDEQDRTGQSVWAHLYIELRSGERVLLLDDRGWRSSADIGDEGMRQIEDTARMVVGPDEPGDGETIEQMQTWYWEWMEHRLRDAGVRTAAVELRAVRHDVEIGDRLRRQIDDRARTATPQDQRRGS